MSGEFEQNFQAPPFRKWVIPDKKYAHSYFMQIPSNVLISSQKVRPSIYMGFCVMAWATVTVSSHSEICFLEKP
jgi:hypothetical protein